MPRLQRLVLSAEQVAQGLNSGKVLLDLRQQHYLARVLRLHGGDHFWAIAQQANLWWQMALSADLQWGILSGMVENTRELGVDLELAIALPKGQTMDQIIPAVSQLGVKRVIPLYSDRSVLQPDQPLSSHKLQRWQRLAEEASELSLRTLVPQISPPLGLREFMAQCTSAYKFIGITQPAPHLLGVWSALWQEGWQSDLSPITLATGCEGGWTPAEVKLAEATGFIAVSLGDRILSASTAPVVALAMINGIIESYAYSAIHPPTPN